MHYCRGLGERLVSVRKEKCLELSTKWKGGIDGGYWRDGLDEIWRDVWSLMVEPTCSKRSRPQASRETYWISARRVGLCNVNHYICSLSSDLRTLMLDLDKCFLNVVTASAKSVPSFGVALWSLFVSQVF